MTGVSAPRPFPNFVHFWTKGITALKRTFPGLDLALGILRLSLIPVRFPYPFWRLQNDGIWKLQGAESLAKRKGHSDAKKSELLKHDVSGGFTADPASSRKR